MTGSALIWPASSDFWEVHSDCHCTVLEHDNNVWNESEEEHKWIQPSLR